MQRDDAPILEFDPSPTAVIEPHHVRERLGHAPTAAVLCLFGEVIERLVSEGAPVLWELSAAHGIHPVYGVDVDGTEVAVFHPGVGAPLAGAFLEEAIECGCERFIGIGMAGGLVPALTIGQVTVPTSAVRDEGTSYHYMPPTREAAPSAAAVEAIEETLRLHDVAYVTGKTWTTDAPYRETKAKVAKRVAEGCITVEMEASAFFAIAAFRDVPLGMMFMTSDDLSGEEWDPSGFGEHLGTRELLFRLAAEAVLRL
ncbi:MAG TPA: nucleoside phosphorylase [Actinomycetota bacterium]|nr:nucleoside phosphorylase [Actinomycetota bacterium]